MNVADNVCQTHRFESGHRHFRSTERCQLEQCLINVILKQAAYEMSPGVAQLVSNMLSSSAIEIIFEFESGYRHFRSTKRCQLEQCLINIVKVVLNQGSVRSCRRGKRLGGANGMQTRDATFVTTGYPCRVAFLLLRSKNRGGWRVFSKSSKTQRE